MKLPAVFHLAPLVAVFALAAPLSAQPSPVAAPSSPEIAPVLPDSPLWLDARGVLSVDETLALLATTAMPEQRAKLERAARERNAALHEANARFAATLRETLAVSDEGLQERRREADRDAEMERIRRFQPLRYQALKRQYDKEKREREKRRQEHEQNAQPPAAPLPDATR